MKHASGKASFRLLSDCWLNHFGVYLIFGSLFAFGSSNIYAATLSNFGVKACVGVGDHLHACPPSDDVLTPLRPNTTVKDDQEDSSRFGKNDASAHSEGYADYGTNRWGFITQAEIHVTNTHEYPSALAIYRATIEDTIFFQTPEDAQSFALGVAAPIFSGSTTGFCTTAKYPAGYCSSLTQWTSEVIFTITIGTEHWSIFHSSTQVGDTNKPIVTDYQTGSSEFKLVSGHPTSFKVSVFGRSQIKTDDCVGCFDNEQTVRTNGIYYDTIYWGGFDRVIDQNGNPLAWTLSTESGIDWGTASPIPEPSIWSSLSGGIFFLAWIAKRRGKLPLV